MDFTAARHTMVNSQVRTNDIPNLRLQQAMEAVPREIFLPAELREQAYVEREIHYAPGRWLLTPRDFAKLISIADPRADDLVLNAVCGAGYSTAVLAHLSGMVVSLESDETLAARAQENLTSLGLANAAVISGDALTGAESQGPFDVIFVGGAIETEPTTLLAQLRDGGRLCAIVKRNSVSKGVIYRRNGDTVSSRDAFDATSKSVLPGFEAEKGFKF